MTTTDKGLETADIETSSDGYAARFAGPVGEWMLEIQETITVALLPKTPSATILDVGGGHGQLATRSGTESANPCLHRVGMTT